MKIECEIIAVKNNGEHVTVTLQGSGKRDAAWRRMGSHSIDVPDTAKNQRAFYLGRTLTITVKLK